MLSPSVLRRAVGAFVLITLSACGGESGASRATDSELLAYINGIKAVDAHAHPLRYVPAGTPADSEFDALPLDGLPPFGVPLGLRPENPTYREAQHALFATSETDTGPAYKTALEKRAYR